jgi:serine/threonine-protein kinase
MSDASVARARRAQELLAEALHLAPAERPEFLQGVCGGDVSLRALVDDLLRFDAAEKPGLEPLPAALLDEAGAGPAAVVSGERSYRLLSELGRGGFGTVFLAERADGQYRQRVAIKRLNLGAFASPTALVRLRQERQILARLAHPHIARLLDGGEMPDGAPFLVLEHIDGMPIDDYCDLQQLAVAERLRLFLAVCDAVEFAHRNLVVHRDLKPSNVLVDRSGQVKLLDFGIAKLLDPDEAPSMLETRRGEAPLTPRYASPEQVRGEAVTTATDVYSLGVLLYELLTGRSPYDEASGSAFALARAVCETDPPRPSTVPPPGEAARRRRRRRRSGPRVDADLDAVVLKAMRKEPAERYRSAGALAEDVERFLAGLPVLARKGSASYRFGKLVRRHKLAFAGAAALVLVVVGFSLSLALQLAETERQRAVAERQRDAAEKVGRFLAETFRLADPLAREGKELSAKQLLDRGAARIEAELGDQPEIKARLLLTMGRAYNDLGWFTDAERLLTAALALSQKSAPPNSDEIAEAALELGRLRMSQARFAEARVLMVRALAIREGVLPDDDPRLAEAINGLANVSFRFGRYAEAAPLYERAVAVARRSGDPGQLGRQLHNLAFDNQQLGRYERAAELHAESIDVLERAYGPDYPVLGWPLNNLGLVRMQQGRLEEAEALFTRTLRVAEKGFGKEHFHVAVPLSNLGALRARQGRAEEARTFFRRALALREGPLGPEHPETTQTLHDWAELERSQGDLAAAIPLYRRALAGREKSLGSGHPDVAASLHGLGLALLAQGDASGLPLLERALAIRRAALPSDHPDRRASEAAVAAASARPLPAPTAP